MRSPPKPKNKRQEKNRKESPKKIKTTLHHNLSANNQKDIQGTHKKVKKTNMLHGKRGKQRSLIILAFCSNPKTINEQR